MNRLFYFMQKIYAAQLFLRLTEISIAINAYTGYYFVI